ncbi:hypothetical protein QCA50_005689 [Cerrena zonata]|uniref:BTB domain-containing protein n=1 Tax=Cerrena zonata TaxID=2478898 RepID=A0AAW0GB31_9APHY
MIVALQAWSDSPELPATDRGTSGDIWSSGTPGKPSNSSGLQHWIKISGSWVKIELDSDERVHHPFLPNVYLLERFWLYDSDVDREAEPLGIEASTSASAATSDRSLKRTRTEDERADKRPTKRHRNLWYEDGNVVVQVENTRFRLFRSKLAKQSPILKRLLDERFSLLRDEEEADVKSFNPGFEIVENCPVISFDSTGVRLKDFEELMTAIEDGYPSHLEPPLFSSLARILEASRILQVERREQWARNAINRFIPLTSIPLLLHISQILS